MSTVGEVQQGTELNGIYRIDEKIAIGGMGEVYRGHNIQTNDPVAIKIVLPEFARDETILALFRKEASVLNHLSHEAIVRYHVFSIDAGIARPYLAMEFVDGESLGDRAGRTPFTVDETIVLTRHLASGLQTAHNAGVIHRDLSPDNIIINKGEVGRAKIIDFGIAKSAKVGGGTLLGGKFAGKYNFVSPEQLGLFGGEVTPKSDIYSLGLVVAAALKGAPLDMSGTQVDVIEKRRHVPDLTGVDSALLPLITAMLQPDPENRPESMAEITDWLAALKTSDSKRSPSAPIFGQASPAPSPGAGETPDTADVQDSDPSEARSAGSGSPDQGASKSLPPGATPSDVDVSASQPAAPDPSDRETPVPPTPSSPTPASPTPASPTLAASTPTPATPSAAEPVPGTPAFASLSLDASDPLRASSAPSSDARLTDSGTVLTQHPTPGAGPSGEGPSAAALDPEPPAAQAAPAASQPQRRRQADAKRPLPTTMVKPDKKSSSFGLIAGIAIVLVALGGGAAYYFTTVDGESKKADGTDPGPSLVPSTGDKEPVDTKIAKGSEGTGPEDKDPTETKPDSGDKPVTIEPPDPPDVVVSQAATMMETVNSFNGGKCFFAAAKDVGDKSLKIEGFGLEAQPFEKLEQLVMSTHGVEPDIGIRKIVNGQCAVVEFLADIRPYETVKPVLSLSNDWIKSGDSLRGNVSNVGDKIISTLLIDNQGVAYNLGPHLKRVGDRADFNIKLVDLAPREAQPQLILTIVSERQIDELQLGSAVLAKTYFPDVLKKMKAVGGEFGTAVKFFKLGG